MKITVYLAIIFIVFFISGCNNEEENDPGDSALTVELKPLGDLAFGADLFACSKNCFSLITVRSDTGYVIDNDVDYTKYKIIANCLEVQEWPEVNFSKNTLLAGVIITPTTCCTTLRIDFTKDLSLPDYTLMVTLQPGPNSTPGAVFYWGVTPKLPEEASVEFLSKYYSMQ